MPIDTTNNYPAAGGGGGGSVNSVTAGNGTVTIGGTSADPTVAVNPLALGLVDSVTAGDASVIVGGTANDPTVRMAALTAGSGIAISGTPATITNNGVRTLAAGSAGVVVGGTANDPTVTPGYGLVGNIAGLSVATAAAAGASSLVARADHAHAITAPVIGDVQQVAAANAVGSSGAFARADHAHAGVTSLTAGAGVALTASQGAITVSAVILDTYVFRFGGVGNYVDTQNAIGGSYSSVLPFAGAIELVPFVPARTVTFDRMGASVQIASGVASSFFRLYLYATGSDNWPSVPLEVSADLDANSATGQEVTINRQLVAGTMYWAGVGVSANVGSTFRIRGMTQSQPPLTVFGGLNGTAPVSALRRTGGYSATPNPFNTVIGTDGISLTNGISLRFRIASIP
jgi:hypothetical protein